MIKDFIDVSTRCELHDLINFIWKDQYNRFYNMIIDYWREKNV